MREKTNEFLTLQKVYDMTEYAYQALAQYPKSEKFALAADIKRVMDEILGYCIEVPYPAETRMILGVNPDDPAFGGDLEAHIRAHYSAWIETGEVIDL